MDEIRCIFCKTESDHVVIEENGYKGRKCPQCGLIYISPRPSSSEIANLYSHDNAHISAESHVSAEFSKRLYAKEHLTIIRTYVKSGALLEIGAGAGYFLDEARKIGFEPHGLEFNPVQASHIRDTLKIPCEESPVNKTIFGGKRFDVIYHCDVISHFFDPISDFKKINEVLKDESLLIFETGNLGEVDQVYFKYFQLFQYPDHLFFFSTDNLVALLEKTGFDLVAMYRYSILPQLRIVKALAGIKESVKEHVFKTIRPEKHSFDAGNADINSVANCESSNVKSLVRECVKKSYQYFDFVLRYKIGRIARKTNRPQTVIVVARKSKQA